MDPLSKAFIRCLEAISHAAKRRVIASLERGLEKDLQKAFRKQGRLFVKSLVIEKSRFYEAEGSDDGGTDWIDPHLDGAEGETDNDFIDPIVAASSLALESAAKQIIANLGLGISFDLKNPRAKAYLEKHGAELVAGINETTRARVKAIINQAVDEGWSYDKTAKLLIQEYEEFAVGRPQDHIASRAHGIAVTELGNAYCEGNAEVVNGLLSAGLTVWKKWDISFEDKACDICKANAEVGWIPANEPFPSGDAEPLAHPYCMCDCLYEVSDVRPED